MAAKRTGGAAKPSKPGGRKTPPVQVLLSQEELAHEIRRWLGEASWLPATELKKRLPKAQQPEGLARARDLASRGELYRYLKGKTEHFFAQDPLERLERLVPELLEPEALPLSELIARLDRAAPGVTQLLTEWLKNAVARRLVFEHATKAIKSKAKQEKKYSTRPDLRSLLKKSLAALDTELKNTDAANVSRERVFELLATELGVKLRGYVPSPEVVEKSGLRESFLNALHRLAAKNGAGALLSVRQLRAESGIDKQAFDAAALALSREGAIVLHHHDHAAALPESERSLLIRDAGGTHYVGIALRRPS